MVHATLGVDDTGWVLDPKDTSKTISGITMKRKKGRA